MISIRQFKSEDRETIRKICADTAMGSFAKNKKKRSAVCLAYVDYYMDEEPQNVLVAVDADDRVLGYIVCSTDTQLYQKKFKNTYLKKIGKYSFVLKVFTRFCLAVNEKFDKLYGTGGFHINISAESQGQKIGPMLMDSMAEKLRGQGVAHMWLVTKNRKTRGYGFYTHYGFREVRRLTFGSVALVYKL